MNGKAIGAIQAKRDGWSLSGDVGCVFIGMAGAIQAYECIGGEELKSVIQEMINRFMEIDMPGIKMQTHACLTALTGIARYYEITGDVRYLNKLEKGWELYRRYGMSENYEIYNWFTVYDSWTEPCGIIDSYILASKLWKFTLKPSYLAEMDLIYFNGICHAMRSNGGFGLDNCPSSRVNYLNVYADEAWWCCTMRGGEGLSRVAENSYFVSDDTLYVTRYGENRATVNFRRNAEVNLTQTSDYPFSDNVFFQINKVRNAKRVVIKLNALSEWADNFKITINGKLVKMHKENGFFVLQKEWIENDRIEVAFNQKIRIEPVMNKENGGVSNYRLFRGPLLWGVNGDSTATLDKVDHIKQIGPKLLKQEKDNVRFTPLYHLLDPTVNKADGYIKQLLFKKK
jgi:DUF1680 family protein